MTGLLISVRSKDEAESVLTACPDLDILDIKEPEGGALGAASPATWAKVANLDLHNTCLSGALGDLEHVQVNDLSALPANTAFAKVGLADQHDQNWIQAWRAIRVLIADSIELVGVIYADHQAAQAPAPEDIIRLLSQEGCQTFLIDTYRKTNGGLFDHLPPLQLKRLFELAPAATFVLAGSLSESTILDAKMLEVDYVGVRGAACSGPREQQICPEKSKHLLTLVKAS